MDGNERVGDETIGRQPVGNTVVVPAPDAPSCVTFLRSLGKRGVRTVVTSEWESDPSFYSRYCDERVVVPAPERRLFEYKDALLKLARRSDVRTIVPMAEADVYVLSKYRDEFENHVAALWPNFETLRTVHDRVRLVEAACEAGVPVPETRLLGEWTDLDRDRIVKPRYAILGREYVESIPPEKLFEPSSTTYVAAGTEPDHDSILAEMGHVPIVQKYVSGTEYAFWALYDRGEPVATCQKHQLRAWDYSGGTSICRETCRIPELEAVGRALLDHLDWHGLASIQFMRDEETGEFVLLEINPRTWISVSAAVRAGADFPYYYWQVAGDHSVREQSDYRVGVATHTLRGEVAYLKSVVFDDYPVVEKPRFHAALRDVVTSLYEQPHVDYFSLDDPLPLLRRHVALLEDYLFDSPLGKTSEHGRQKFSAEATSTDSSRSTTREQQSANRNSP